MKASSYMCGIIGYIGKQPAIPVLIEGLEHPDFFTHRRRPNSEQIRRRKATVQSSKLKAQRRELKLLV